MTGEFLKRCALFKDFTPVGLDILARIAKPRILLPGNTLFQEGQPAEALYVIVEGRLSIRTRTPEGQDVPMASLGAGEHLSELALLAAGRNLLHLCSAVAEADTKLFEISANDFQALMKEKPQACMKLLLAAAAEFGRKSAEAREPLKHLLSRAVTR